MGLDEAPNFLEDGAAGMLAEAQRSTKERDKKLQGYLP